MNRRNFLKNIGCLLGGALASVSGFVSAGLGADSTTQKPLTLEMLQRCVSEKVGFVNPLDVWEDESVEQFKSNLWILCQQKNSKFRKHVEEIK